MKKLSAVCKKTKKHLTDTVKSAKKRANEWVSLLKIKRKRLFYKPKLSLVLVVDKSEKDLNRILSSVLDAPNVPKLELILVGDGLAEQPECSRKYRRDKRLFYYPGENTGAADALTYGVEKTVGELLLCRGRAGVLKPETLNRAFAYMSGHPEIDLCGFSDIGKTDITEAVDIGSLADGVLSDCCTLMMRKNAVSRLPYLYESYYNGCEAYKLLCTAASHAFRLCYAGTDCFENISELPEAQQEKNRILISRVRCACACHNADTDGEMTVIIPFRDEGMEIEKTVCNIRATAKNVPILLIDDGSKDGYDYLQVAQFWNCRYIRNEKSQGVSRCRDFGIEQAETEYFVLLDGHMRFYEDGWTDRLLATARENPKSIVFPRNIVIMKNENNKNENEDDRLPRTENYGAYVDFYTRGCEFQCKWSQKPMREYGTDTLFPAIVCLGACYCCDKSWWQYIGGLQGLIMWGQDEPLISIKTWLAGGQILLMDDMFVGHVYRKAPPYQFYYEEICSNSIMMNHLFLQKEEDIQKYDKNLEHLIGEEAFAGALASYQKRAAACEVFKEHFWKDIAVYNLEWFRGFNNLAK